MSRKKILAVASMGGHWIQLLRLRPAFDGNDICYVSNNPSFASMVDAPFISVRDSNRNNKFGILVTFFQIFKIVFQTKPDIIITTGAAPGILALMIGKVFNKTTIWVDSIANADELSMSGKFALKFADRVYTQWPELAKGKIIYAGNVIS